MSGDRTKTSAAPESAPGARPASLALMFVVVLVGLVPAGWLHKAAWRSTLATTLECAHEPDPSRSRCVLHTRTPLGDRREYLPLQSIRSVWRSDRQQGRAWRSYLALTTDRGVRVLGDENTASVVDGNVESLNHFLVDHSAKSLLVICSEPALTQALLLEGAALLLMVVFLVMGAAFIDQRTPHHR